VTLRDLIDRWSKRRDEWARFHAHVDGAAIAGELLTDLAELQRRAGAESVLLPEAAQLSGYSIEHLRRLVATGKIENVSANGRIRVRRADLPQKATKRPLPTDSGPRTLSLSRSDVASDIMRSIA
jgi:hypothetical protein